MGCVCQSVIKKLLPYLLTDRLLVRSASFLFPIIVRRFSSASSSTLNRISSSKQQHEGFQFGWMAVAWLLEGTMNRCVGGEVNVQGKWFECISVYVTRCRRICAISRSRCAVERSRFRVTSNWSLWATGRWWRKRVYAALLIGNSRWFAQFCLD